MKRKLSPIEVALKEKAQHELQACEAAILERLGESPAQLKELDSIGYEIVKNGHPQVVVNQLLTQLQHQEKVKFDFSSHRYYKEKNAEVRREHQIRHNPKETNHV